MMTEMGVASKAGRQQGQRLGASSQQRAVRAGDRISESILETNMFGTTGPRTESHMLIGFSVGDNKIKRKRRALVGHLSN